jgi:hypothetical protein
MAEVSEALTDWKSDYTGGDTNTPAGVSDPGSTGAATSLGAWLRSLKAITRALTLEPGFDVMPTAATYLSASSFEVAAADLTHTVGDSVLISLASQDLRAYVTSFLHLSGPTRTQFSVIRIQQLNGTAAVLDGTLTHVRWSQHRFPTYPWSWHDRHGANAVPAFATLPFREQMIYTVWLKTGETSIEVHLPYEMPDTNYRVKLTPTSVTDAATVRAYATKTIVKTTSKVTFTMIAPPTGLNVFTVWIWRD